MIDKAPPSPLSRAVSLHARSLELLDTMGLAESFVEHGHQVRRFRMYAGKRSLLNLDMTRNGSRYGFILHLPQSETERLLRERVHELGGRVEHGVELVRLVEQGDVVNVTLRDAAGREIELGVDYVVGCDGAHSRVRHELGLAFAGQPYPHDWLLADVAMDGVGPDDETHIFFRSDGRSLVCIPMGHTRWRVVIADVGDRAGRTPSCEEIQDLVDQRAPRHVVVSDPGWLADFRCQLRAVTTYRRGRVLLAGDAAHIHSPAGGQGMNTGMMDANNVAWKLALVAGGAPDGLLDTYGQERLPVASNVLRFTDRLVGWTTMRHPVQRILRDTLIPAATSLPTAQHRVARRLSQVSVAYPPNPLVRPDGARRGPRPGERVPDLEVDTDAGRSRLYRVLGGGRHVLVVSDVVARAAIESGGLGDVARLVDTVAVCQMMHRSRRDAYPAFVLVRPDGVLAVRGSRGETHTVVEYLRRLSVGHRPAESAPVGP